MIKLYTWIRAHLISLLALSVGIIFVIILLSLQLLFRHTFNAVDDQTNSLNNVILNQAKYELDNMLRTVSSLSPLISSNQLVSQFAGVGKPKNPADHYLLYKLVQSFSSHRSFLSANSIIEDFAVYYPSSDIFVRSSAFQRTQDFFTSKFFNSEIEFKNWQQIISSNYNGRFILEASNENLITYIQSTSLEVAPTVNIIIFLNRPLVEKFIASIEQQASHIFVMLDTLLLHAGTADNETMDVMKSFITKTDASTTKMSITRLNSNSFRNVSYFITDISDHVSQLPKSSLMKFYNVSVLTTIVTVLLAISFLFIWVLPSTYKIFVRVRKSRHETNASSVQLIKQTIDTVLSRNKIVINMVDQWPILKDALLDQLTRSNSPSEGILHSLSLHNICFSSPFFVVIIFTFIQSSNSESKKQICLTTLNKYFQNIVNACFALSEDSYAVLINFSDPDLSCFAQVETMRKDCSSSSRVPVTACIGSTQEGTNGIRQSYEDAVSLLDYTIFSGIDVTLDYNSYPQGEVDYSYSMDTEMGLIAAVRVGNYESVALLIDQIHQDNFVNRQLRPDIARLLLSELTATALKILSNRENKYFESESLHDYAAKILRCNTVEDIFSELRGIYLWACEEQSANIMTTRKREIDEYILAHYTNQDFSVSSMADDLNLSPNYLSAQFKSLFNSTIISYVTDLRLKLASDLLCTSDLSINDIANKSGFSSSETLNRAFKRRFLVTPGLYRRGIQNKQTLGKD